MEVKQFAKAIAWIRENIDPEINIQKIAIFLLVAQNEGIPQPEIGEKLGLMSGSVSRHLMKMGVYIDKRVNQERGLGLVIQTPNPANRRQMSVYLSEKGKEVLKRLESIVKS